MNQAPSQSPNVEYDVIGDAPETTPQDRLLAKLRDEADFTFIKAEDIVSLCESDFENLEIEEIKYKLYLLSMAAGTLETIIGQIETMPKGKK